MLKWSVQSKNKRDLRKRDKLVWIVTAFCRRGKKRKQKSVTEDYTVQEQAERVIGKLHSFFI